MRVPRFEQKKTVDYYVWRQSYKEVMDSLLANNVTSSLFLTSAWISKEAICSHGP